jgi:hypothetical protein
MDFIENLTRDFKKIPAKGGPARKIDIIEETAAAFRERGLDTEVYYLRL